MTTRGLLFAAAFAASLLLTSQASYAVDGNDAAKTIYSNTKGDKAGRDWSEYLTDTAAGSISAAGMLGVSGESVTTVENLRDVLVGLKGLNEDGDGTTLAIAVTPGRTSLSPISFKDYYSHWYARLAANTTLGYAQGDTDIQSISFERRAVSIETSLIFRGRDDIAVAFPLALAEGSNAQAGKCDVMSKVVAASTAMSGQIMAEAASKSQKPLVEWTQDEIDAAVDSGTLPQGTGVAMEDVTEKISADTKAQIKSDTEACYKSVVAGMRWNPSRMSIAYGEGWIKAKDSSGGDESLGKTLVVSLAYGFDGLGPLSKYLLISASYRHTTDEPVLESLVTGPFESKSTELWTARLTGGSSRIRGLVEVSNIDKHDVTASQRTFKQAAGFDIRLREATWINLRLGRQRSIDGTKDETGSLLSISYSPTALMKF